MTDRIPSRRADRPEHLHNRRPLGSAVPSFDEYDLTVIGTGFASTFFLREWLEKAPFNARVLVLERGRHDTHAWQREHKRPSSFNNDSAYRRSGSGSKLWNFSVGFGGGSNCWTGCTPRMLPNDFRMHSQYGVGMDWPITYEEIEPYYCETEQAMGISGFSADALAPRSAPYPLPPHNLCDPELVLQRAYPGQYFPQACARPRNPTGRRPGCCASGNCMTCPIDSKFTIQNSFDKVYRDPRVELLLEHEATRLDLAAGQARAVFFKKVGEASDTSVKTGLVAIGANALFNAALLLQSGLQHPMLGRYLHEQLGTSVQFDLKGMSNFQGTTMITGQGFMFYDGEHRRHHGGCLTEYMNTPRWLLRHEFGRWTERMEMTFVIEDLPQRQNHIALDDKGNPVAHFAGYSEYGRRGLRQVRTYADQIASLLPVEAMRFTDAFEADESPRPTESHIQGTVRMGATSGDGVVDRHLRLYSHPNVLVLGSSSFPTGAPANPTLTLSALSIMSARSLW